MICAVVLAAGRSRRMGAQKLLLPYGGSTIIAHIADQLLASDVDRVYLVVGQDGNAVVAAVGERPVQVVRNPSPDSEMLESARCGLRALPGECEAILIVLGDQPTLTPGVVNAMVAAFQRERRGIIVPVHEGKRGHPLLISARYRDEIMKQHDETGLRGLLWAHPDEVFELEVADAGVLHDVDYPEDYKRESGRLEV